MASESTRRSLGDCLKQARQRRFWSQSALAKEAGVSTRTIVALETHKRESARADVVARLARALKADPKEWLILGGHTDFAGDKLQRTLRAAGGFQFPDEMDPADFFSRMLEELSEATPSLMCVCYPSVPGTNHRPDVRNILTKALQQGLTLALVCPFPNANDSIENSAKPSLLRYYREVYDHVILLARDLAEKLKPNRKRHIAVFVPAQNSDVLWWTMPAMGVSKVRQALIKRLDEVEGRSAGQLMAWVELVQDKKDRMVEIYPTQEITPDRINIFRCWEDYFSEIIDDYNPVDGWGDPGRTLQAWRSITFTTEEKRRR